MASGTQHVTEQLDQVIVRFAGDSGDGMQLTGDRFTTTSALFGNDLSTFPDFPAEIRAPAGTLERGVGVPGPHLRPRHPHPGRRAQRPGGDEPGRAQGQHRRSWPRARSLIVNSDAFEERDLAKAGYAANPLTDGSLAAYTVYEVPMTSITQEVCKEAGRQAPRRRAVEELLRSRPRQLAVHPSDRAHPRVDRRAVRRPSRRWSRPTRGRSGPGTTSARRPSSSSPTTRSRPATFEPGEYVQVTGNTALAWGLITAARLAGLPLFLGSYPITPASDILHELAGARSSASAPSRPRTRSPASAPPSAPPSAARSA